MIGIFKCRISFSFYHFFQLLRKEYRSAVNPVVFIIMCLIGNNNLIVCKNDDVSFAATAFFHAHRFKLSVFCYCLPLRFFQLCHRLLPIHCNRHKTSRNNVSLHITFYTYQNSILKIIIKTQSSASGGFS